MKSITQLLEDEIEMINDCRDIEAAAILLVVDLGTHESRYEREHSRLAFQRRLRRETSLGKVYTAFQCQYKLGVKDKRDLFKNE